jgi:hypothetical protein
MKKLLLFLFLVFSAKVFAQSPFQGPNLPDSTYQCTACPGVPWTNNPPNWVIFFMPADTFSTILYYSDFGFSIPSASTIIGIRVDFSGDFLNPYAKDTLLQLMLNSSLLGSNLAMNLPYSQVARTYGDSLNTWGAALSAGIVNDPDFGVALQIDTDSGAVNGGLPKPTMTVYYQDPTTGTMNFQTSGQSEIGYFPKEHALLWNVDPGDYVLRVFDTLGRLIDSGVIAASERGGKFFLPSSLPDGVFIASLETQEGKVVCYTRFSSSLKSY